MRRVKVVRNNGIVVDVDELAERHDRKFVYPVGIARR